jgi:flagellar motor switch/type III secretory pathway protein FliN
MVVFENSSIDKLKLYIFGQEMDVNLNPNMNLLISEDNNGGNNMAESHNIWDNIEVEMNAEFDAVKISLKELKNIEKGIVVDLASLYDNKVTLKVENNPIASGSLVIVNDRYGVKIEEIIANSNAANENTDSNTEETETVENSSIDEETEDNLEQEEEFSEEETEGNPGEEEEEFDYSDFELEDENI